jgi:myo-inositol-1(or 4)-monophosphatase
MDVTEALEFTREMVAEAAARAMRMVEAGVTIDTKPDGSVVTDVDRAIEQFLRDAIAARYPGHAILGEEYGHASTGDASVLWALDPIDGTTNLANGLPFWGVSVGLIVDDEPVVGVFSAPLLGETYAAARGHGASRNGRPLPDLGAGGPTGWEDTYAICSTSVRALAFDRLPARLRVLGSAALDLCLVGAGSVRGCHSIGTSLYDIAAGVCVAHEVGARTEWLLPGPPWSPAEMAREGPREAVLITAPPATLAFLRERLA